MAVVLKGLSDGVDMQQHSQRVGGGYLFHACVETHGELLKSPGLVCIDL